MKVLDRRVRWFVLRVSMTGMPSSSLKGSIHGGLPPMIRGIVGLVYQHIVAKQINGPGIGRYNADEIFHLGQIDLDALSAFLGEKPYFMGNKSTSLDACAFGILINTVCGPIESLIKDYGLSKNNLVLD